MPSKEPAKGPAKESTGDPSESPSKNPIDKPAKKWGLVEKGGKLYYYKHKDGKKLKNSWKVVRNKTYYFSKDGSALKGAKKIEGVRRLFNKNHQLVKSNKPKLKKYREGTYCVTKNGRVLDGWRLLGGKLYHFAKNGKMDKNCKIGGVSLKKTGAARKSDASMAKVEALKILDRITNDNMTRAQKLRCAWSYLTSHAHFHYRGVSPNTGKKGWQYTLALNMLATRGGNCFSFAVAFAQFSQVIGYEPYVIVGGVSSLSGGYTPHGWVRINGRYYDPEGKFEGFINCYGSACYAIGHRVGKVVRF